MSMHTNPPDSSNPYAAPTDVAPASRSDDSPSARLARRVRFWTRAVGISWIFSSMALFFVLTTIGMECTQHHIKLGHTIMREADSIRDMLPVMPSLFVLGVLALFRVRWAIWSGVLGGIIALAWFGSQLAYWQQYEMDYAKTAGGILAGVCCVVVAGGGAVLWLTYRLSRAGISYHWNPDALEIPWYFAGKLVDRRLVLLNSRRHWQAGWFWIFAGAAIAVAIFPCFLWLPEGYHRPTAVEWTVAGIVQGLAVLVGITAWFVGVRILRRDYRTILSGTVAAYAFAAINAINLMSPYPVPPFYTDMVFIVSTTLIAVGLFLGAISHSALWLHRELSRQRLPVTIQIRDLSPEQDS